jgi:TPR repeat protein
MEAVTFFGRLIFSLLFLLLAQADSIIFSKSLVDYYFKQSQHYVYPAALLGNNEANYQIYLATQDQSWLKKAARLNHVKSVFQWYLIQKENQHISQTVWLQQAINLKHPQATLIKLQNLTTDEHWHKASEFEHLHSEILTNLEGELGRQYSQIKLLLAAVVESNESVHISPSITPPNDVNNVLLNQPASLLKCAISIQAVVSTKSLLANAKRFSQAFAGSKLNGLSICFLPPKVMLALPAICKQDQHSRIECSLDKLAQSLLENIQVDPRSYNHLMVIVEKGDANTRGGLMYLDKGDTDQVFIHELAHWLGYTDEYQIKAKQQQQLCVVNSAKWISSNIFVASNKTSQEQAEYLAGRKLYKANTCKNTEFNAYKLFPDLSFMEYLDLPLSQQYADHITDNQDYKKITPVAMNFWSYYLAKKNRTSINSTDKQYYNDKYLAWIKVAAEQNSPLAMTLLAQSYIESQEYAAAFSLLYDAAQLNNANAQLLLGHGYIEGRWLPQNTIKSAYWYKQAADQNDPYGLYFLAKCHEMGWGCELSFEKAIGYYKQAKSLGNGLAAKRLERLSPRL